MPPYAYPITINLDHKQINYIVDVEIESDQLNLSDLIFIGSDNFTIGESDFGYVVSVYRTRLETEEERAERVSGELAYMVEYNRRRKNADEAVNKIVDKVSIL